MGGTAVRKSQYEVHMHCSDEKNNWHTHSAEVQQRGGGHV